MRPITSTSAPGPRGKEAPSSSLEIGPYRPGDEVSICRLFGRVFGKDKQVEHWRWQFLESAPEPHVFVARTHDGRIAGQFACIPRRVQVRDQELIFAQSVDSMVDPTFRTGLKRPGLFAEIVRSYVDHFGRVEREALGYGLPNRAAYRIGRRFLGYTPLCEIRLWARNTQPAVSVLPADIEMSIASAPEPDHDDFWRRVRPRFGLIAVRDRRFLDWRYARCPAASYSFITARRRGELTALVVYRPACFEPRCATLVDLLWDGRDRAGLATCVRVAEHCARRDGHEYLVAMLRDDTQEQQQLASLGYGAVPFELPLVGRTYHPTLELDWVRRHWWYTFGDFDLV